ncbi:MAG: tRNA 2-thiouridine(34) synthase MnmA [Hydrotalea sp.]|nr:tRNA 2-thiouridine(34) synthase MnmA [Hydrotalea sp.]
MNQPSTAPNAPDATIAAILARLEIDLAPRSRVLVAMSGGVDSSVVAAVLKHLGHDVMGVTLQLYDHGAAVKKKGACCAGADIDDAKMVAQQIDIPHYVLNYEDRFSEKVIDDFVESYLRGETPLPCVRCNQTVKFNDLYAMAKKLGVAALATGHYVRRVATKHGPQLLVGGQDTTSMQKDQSYFLFTTSRDQLDFLRFPLGNLSKDETRALARYFKLDVAQKPDSQDICFVPGGDYRAVIKEKKPDAMQTGDIVLQNGTVVGQHQGVVDYTVGQRRGLKIGGRKKKPGDNQLAGDHDALFVLAVDPSKNRVVVGDKQQLLVDKVTLQECYWLTDVATAASREVSVKYRSTMAPVKARLIHHQGKIAVEFATPAIGVAAGQALVLYDMVDEPTQHDTARGASTWRLLGGGFITRDHLQPFLSS